MARRLPNAPLGVAANSKRFVRAHGDLSQVRPSVIALPPLDHRSHLSDIRHPSHMRIALLSDIHGNLPALQAVVEDIERRGVDVVANLGDSLSGPLLPLETAQFLMQRDWLHLAGNHERQLLTQRPDEWGASDAYAHSCLTAKELDWLATFPPTALLCPEVFLCHATPESDMRYFLETVESSGVRTATASEVDARLGDCQAELVACGHTHLPRSMRASTGQLIVNPGSVGLPAYDARRPYPHVIETGSPDARYAIVEQRDDQWTCMHFAVPYRHQAMASLARSRKRPEWACALQSGYVTSHGAETEARAHARRNYARPDGLTADCPRTRRSPTGE